MNHKQFWTHNSSYRNLNPFSNHSPPIRNIFQTQDVLDCQKGHRNFLKAIINPQGKDVRNKVVFITTDFFRIFCSKVSEKSCPNMGPIYLAFKRMLRNKKKQWTGLWQLWGNNVLFSITYKFFFRKQNSSYCKPISVQSQLNHFFVEVTWWSSFQIYGKWHKRFQNGAFILFSFAKDEQQNCAVNLHLKCHLKENHTRNVIHNPWAQQIKTADIQTLHRYKRIECSLTFLSNTSKPKRVCNLF